MQKEIPDFTQIHWAFEQVSIFRKILFCKQVKFFILCNLQSG